MAKQTRTPRRSRFALRWLAVRVEAAGPEIGGGNFLNDTAPEETAAELQAVASVHYLEGRPT